MIRCRTWLLVWVGILALGPCLGAAGRLPHVGDQVDDFVFTDFAGNQHHLSDFAGRYVLLDFWATWCQPCLKEIPELKAASQQFQSRGLVIVGMNSDQKVEKARQFVNQNSVTWLQSSPPSTKEIIKHSLKVEWYPALILLGAHGKVLAISEGENGSLYGSMLPKTLDQLLPPLQGAR
jgi:thiol-disulfide isomerase/thioredoxin